MKSWADFKVIMPYANDLFGVYQPLLRWKSRIFGNRFDKFRNAIFPNLAGQARWSQRAPLQAQLDRVTSTELATDTGPQALSISDLKPVAVVSQAQPDLEPTIDCGIARLLQRDIGKNPSRDWRCRITPESMTTLLEQLKTIVAKPTELQNFPEIAEYVQRFTQGIAISDQALAMQSLFNKEARVSSFLLFLSRHKPSQLNDLFFTRAAGGSSSGGLTITARTARHLGQTEPTEVHPPTSTFLAPSKGADCLPPGMTRQPLS